MGAILVACAVVLLASCSLRTDLDVARDGSGSGVVIARGRDLVGDIKDFRKNLVENGFSVTADRSSQDGAERVWTCEVTFPPFVLGTDHPLISSMDANPERVLLTLNRKKLKSDVPYEIHLSLPGTVIEATGGTFSGTMAVYPGPDPNRTWMVTYRPSSGVSIPRIIVGLGLAVMVGIIVIKNRARPAHQGLAQQ